MSEEPETTATTNNDDIPEDFHPYVRLLIIRMRSHPEEFNPLLAEPDPNKKDFMTYDEKQFVWREERKLVMDASHETLMRQIMKANEPEEDLNETTIAKQLQAWQQMNAMQSNSVLYNQNYVNQIGAQAAGISYPSTYNAMQAQIPMGYAITPPTTADTTSSEVLTEANMLEKMKRALGL